MGFHKEMNVFSADVTSRKYGQATTKEVDGQPDLSFVILYFFYCIPQSNL